MSENKNKVKNKITLRVDLTEKPERWPKFVAYLTTRSGRIVSKQELKPEKGQQIGVAEFDIDSKQKSLILKVGPEVDDPRLLERYNPYVKAFELADEIKVDIPREIWYCWLYAPYVVTGTVKKAFPGKLSPICIGEVEIYDVDLKYCFLKLPYIIIERIRNSIIDIIVDPPPCDPLIIERIEEDIWWRNDEDDFCGTGPKPPFPPKAVDIRSKLEALPEEWNFAVERYERLSTARTRVNTKLQEMSMQERRVFLNSNALEGLTISKVLYSNTKQFRELLIDNLVHIKYWLCWWPWIYWLWWPYCRYSIEKLGETSLNPDGSFNKTVWLSICRNDTPDLWFKVKQIISGVERVIYSKYPVPCNTYWNHPSGVPVHLQVTHPLAEACIETKPGIPDLYVMPIGIGGEDEWYQVENAHIKSNCDPAISLPSNSGLYDGTDPYGTRLDLRMQFHDEMHEYYYKWSYRLHGESDWTPIDTPINHRYIEWVDGEWVITYENLGPKTEGSETGLFMVPDPTRAWLGNRNDDLAYAIWYTPGWDIAHNVIKDGKYDLKLEIFDKDGNKATPETAGFKFILPTDVIGEVDDELHVEPGGELIMHLHVDNMGTVAEIKTVTLNDEPTGECQFLEYHKDTEKLGIEYVAYHPTTPENFLASYSLSVIRGISGTEVEGFSSSTPVREGEPAVKVEYTVSHLLRREPPLEPLEEPYEQCAFSISLHTYPRTRNGYSRIGAYEASDGSAFALTKRRGQPGGGSP